MSTHEFVQRGRELLERSEFQEAVKVCRRGLLAHPAAVDGRLVLGRALMALRRYGEVVSEMRVVLDGDARQPEALALMGEALLHKRELGKAFQVLKQAHEVAPEDPAVAALFRQAESAAGDTGALDFAEEDPSAGQTMHYPMNRLPGMFGAQDEGPRTIPLRTRGRAGASAADQRKQGGQEQGASEIYLEAGAVAEAGADELIEELLDVPAGASTSPSGAPARRTAPSPASSPDAALGARAMVGAETDQVSEPVSGELIEEISDDLVEEVRSSSSMSLTQVIVPRERPSTPGGARNEGGFASRSSSFDEPTVIYRSSDSKPDAQLPEDNATRPESPSAAARKENVVTDHYPSLSTRDSTPGAAASAPGGASSSGSGPARLPLSPSAELTAQSSSSVTNLPDLSGADEDDDEPPTQMIPRDGAWRSSESMDTNAMAAAPSRAAQSGAPAPPIPPPPHSPSMFPAVRPPSDDAPGSGRRPALEPPRPTLDSGDRGGSPAPGPMPARPVVPPAAAAAGRGARPPARANHGPTAFVPRQRPHRRRNTILYILAALVVVAGGGIAGLQIRKVRLEREIAAAREQAAGHVERGTYSGYMHAWNAYGDILAVLEESPPDQAALARILAVLAADYGEGLSEARGAVDAVREVKGPDAAAARAYLALAEGDAATAQAQAQEVRALAPEDPHGPYLAGCASLLAGRAGAAVSDFEQALAGERRPIFHVGLGQAHLAQGDLDQAEAAFRGALKLVPGYPAAVLGLAGVALARPGQVPGNLSADLQSLVEQGTKPLDEQEAGVPPRRAAQALLAVAALRLRDDDEDGAREAIARARATGREGDPVVAVGLARLLERMGDLEAARAEARTVVETFPARLDARVILARTALAMGEAESALRALTSATADGGTNDGNDAVDVSGHALALTLRGRAHLALGDQEAAAGDLESALALDADLAPAVVARAELDLRQGNAAAAVERLEPMVGAGAGGDTAPNTTNDATPEGTGGPNAAGQTADDDMMAEARVVYATALRHSGRLAEARKVIQSLIESPAAGRAHLELARLERKQGNYARARAAYTKAAESLPGLDARLELALLAFDTGKREDACEAIAAVAKEFAGSSRALLEAARIHTMTGRHEEAAGYLDDAAALDATPRWQIEKERGRLALRGKDLEAAIAALEKAIELQDRDPESHLLLIDAHLEKRDYKAAGRVRDQVVERFDETSPIRSLAVARVASTSMEPDKAMRAFEQARTLLEKQGATPRELHQVTYMVARAYYFADNLRDAEKVLQGLLRRDPEHADAHFVLGLVEYALEQPRSAIAAFERALELDPRSHPDAWFYLGEVSYQNNLRKQAVKAFRSYLEQAPQRELAPDAKAYLDELE